MLSKRAPDYIGGLRASICCRVPGSHYVPPAIMRGINAPDGLCVFPERGKTIGNSQDTCPRAHALVPVHCFLSTASRQLTEAERRGCRKTRGRSKRRVVKMGDSADAFFHCRVKLGTFFFISSNNYHCDHR